METESVFVIELLQRGAWIPVAVGDDELSQLKKMPV